MKQFEDYLRALKMWQLLYISIKTTTTPEQLQEAEAKLQDTLQDYIDYRIEQSKKR